MSVLWPTLAGMTTYNGKALIICEDGTKMPVTANLSSYSSGLLTSWSGPVTAAPDGLREMSNLTKGRLRFPDGKEAEFLRPDTSDWVHTNRLSITGQDEAPF
jgi:hypothetical protein